MQFGWAVKIFSWISGLNIGDLAKSAVDAYSKSKDTEVSLDMHEKNLIARSLELDTQQAQINANLAKGEPGYVRQLYAYGPAIYFLKLFVWDKTLGLGVTDDISERMFWVAQTIIISYFGTRVARDIVNAWRDK